jgi:hypothetical protein
MALTRHQIFFELSPDSTGYPPAEHERLWALATEVPMEYLLDNIPFFARSATMGDRIRVQSKNDKLWFRETIIASTNSLIRAIARKDPLPIKSELEKMGCACELSAPFHLVAANVPREKLQKVKARLTEWVKTGEVDYEEALLRL